MTDEELLSKALLMPQSKLEDEQGESWFVAKDVAEVLGYRDGPNMIRHIDPEDTSSHKMRRTSGSGGGNPNVKIINESGLYAAILRSRRPDAKKFKRHVTSEILPSIRKHGGYIQGQEEGGLGWICRNLILTGKEFAFYKMSMGTLGSLVLM